MSLSEGYKEDLRNHYQDGYQFGGEDAFDRISEIVTEGPTMVSKEDLLAVLDEEKEQWSTQKP